MVVAANKKKLVVKKHRTQFTRFHSDRYKRVKPSWRRPHGIDNQARRRFKGSKRMPKVGYGSDNQTNNKRPDGFYVFNVSNLGELDLLLMHNRRYAAVVNHNVSAKKRKKICERAAQLNVKVINGHARLRSVEKE